MNNSNGNWTPERTPWIQCAPRFAVGGDHARFQGVIYAPDVIHPILNLEDLANIDTCGISNYDLVRILRQAQRFHPFDPQRRKMLVYKLVILQHMFSDASFL